MIAEKDFKRQKQTKPQQKLISSIFSKITVEEIYSWIEIGYFQI